MFIFNSKTVKYSVQYIYHSFFILILALTIGCGDAGSIVTPKQIDITKNEKGVPVVLDIPIGTVAVSGSMNTGNNTSQISPKIVPTVSKVRVYRFPDSTYAISMDCGIYNNTIRVIDTLLLDSIFLRTGVFQANGNSVLLENLISSSDTLASKFNFTNEDLTVVTTIDSLYKVIDSIFNNFDPNFRLYNLTITRTIDSAGIQVDTVQDSSFNPFAPPNEQARFKRDSIKITLVTKTIQHSKTPFTIDPMNTGPQKLAPTLTASSDANKKQINAHLTFISDNVKEYYAKFRGRNVRLDLDIVIPIP